MDEPTDFQRKLRTRLLERMALRAMLQGGAQGRSLGEARRDSIAWLESNMKLTDAIAGDVQAHPALAELYTAEAREVIDDLIAETKALAQELEAEPRKS